MCVCSASRAPIIPARRRKHDSDYVSQDRDICVKSEGKVLENLTKVDQGYDLKPSTGKDTSLLLLHSYGIVYKKYAYIFAFYKCVLLLISVFSFSSCRTKHNRRTADMIT
jgi:hypothetical protein